MGFDWDNGIFGMVGMMDGRLFLITALLAYSIIRFIGFPWLNSYF